MLKRLEQKDLADAESAEGAAKQELAREEAECLEKEAVRQHEERMFQLQKDLAESKAEQSNISMGEGHVPNSYTPKIPPFDESRDNLDSYLERFERFANSQKWEKENRAVRLSALLKGKALEVYSRLPAEEAMNYDKLKLALLRRIQMTEEGYKLKLRTSRPEKSEAPSQFAARLASYLDNWVKMANVSKTYDDLRDLLLREQFVVSCCKDLAVFLKERKCINFEGMLSKLRDLMMLMAIMHVHLVATIWASQ